MEHYFSEGVSCDADGRNVFGVGYDLERVHAVMTELGVAEPVWFVVALYEVPYLEPVLVLVESYDVLGLVCSFLLEFSTESVGHV